MGAQILIIIPVYNCEKQIGRVLRQLCDVELARFSILVLDNGSKDNTVEGAISVAKTMNADISIQRNGDNLNLGGSLKKGFLHAIDNGYEYVVVLHGDDQATFSELVPLLDNDSLKTSDFLIGARFHPKSNTASYSLFRVAGNKALNTLFSIVTGYRVYDLIAGLNLYRVDCLKGREFLRFPNDLTFDVHLLLFAVHKRFRVNFFPISWRTDDQVSNAKVVKQGLIIVRLLLRYAFTGERVFDLPERTQNFGGQTLYSSKDTVKA